DIVMDERQQNHSFADLGIDETNPAGKSRLCIDNHSARASCREFLFVQRKQRFKLRPRQSNDSKIRVHSDTMSISSHTNTRFLLLFWRGDIMLELIDGVVAKQCRGNCAQSDCVAVAAVSFPALRRELSRPHQYRF